MANIKSVRRTVIIWILVLIAAFLIGYYILPALTSKAHGVNADDMTREQQVRLMAQCVNDLSAVIRQTPRRSGLHKEESARIIQLFWDYRTRER